MLRRRVVTAVDPVGCIVQVAALLRSGARPDVAWHAVGVGCDAAGCPMVDDLGRAGLLPRHSRAVVSAGLLARDLGAPLAPVLEALADTIGADLELDGERAAASAGPRTSVRVLSGLPVVALALGALMGANPVAVLSGGGVGSMALAGGGFLMWAGRRWSAALVRSAQRAGTQ